MSYSYVASNKNIENLLRLTTNDTAITNEDKPDIAIYTNNKDDCQKVVFIELKKFSAEGYDNSKGLDQLIVYSDYIAESGIQEIYCYLIVSIDDKTRRILKGRGYVKIFSSENGEIWQGKVSDMNSYIQIISPQSIIADANARNKTFLAIIQNAV